MKTLTSSLKVRRSRDIKFYINTFASLIIIIKGENLTV